MSTEMNVVDLQREISTSTPSVVTSGASYLPNVTGYTGGGVTNLDGATTVGIPIGTLYKVVVDGSESEWRLQAGTAVTDVDAGVIRPVDYNALTNAKNLVRVIGF